MSNISLDVSAKIDSALAELLETMDRHARALNTPFFVAGATARDLILDLGYQISAGRVTRDLDLAVMVEGWDAYDRLNQALVATGQFVENSRIHHRLLYKDSWPVDLIPFGPVEAPPGTIAWPPDRAEVMKVLGFREILEQRLLVRIRKGLDVPVASLAGLAVMKLIAWHERRAERDAADLALLLKHYAAAGNEERLFGEQQELLKAEGHDHERAGARLLGRDMARLMAQATRAAVLAILRDVADPETNDRLITAIGQKLGMDQYEEAETLLGCLKRGIDETAAA